MRVITYRSVFLHHSRIKISLVDNFIRVSIDIGELSQIKHHLGYSSLLLWQKERRSVTATFLDNRRKVTSTKFVMQTIYVSIAVGISRWRLQRWRASRTCIRRKLSFQAFDTLKRTSKTNTTWFLVSLEYSSNERTMMLAANVLRHSSLRRSWHCILQKCDALISQVSLYLKEKLFYK